MRNSLLPRILFSAFLAMCAAAPVFLTGCSDDDSGGQDLATKLDQGANVDLTTPAQDLSGTNTDASHD